MFIRTIFNTRKNRKIESLSSKFFYFSTILSPLSFTTQLYIYTPKEHELIHILIHPKCSLIYKVLKY